MLQAASLTCVKGDHVLFDHLDLSIHPGQIYQISGANGTGKTCLLKILAGLSPPEEGAVFWNGEPIQRHPDKFRSLLAYLGHSIGLKLDLTPTENLEFWSSLYGASQTPLADALIRVGLKDQAHIACRYLSAGQRRRAAIARFQINDALVWILDEPLTALDSSGIKSVCQTIDAHLDRGGLVVITSHQPITLDRHPVEEFRIQGTACPA
tara:strand:- start:14 stop:640 length:627 start_codon:yes stop_codon:yes gene_type:complete